MNKSLTKSSNKVIAGVGGGLAAYFGMDYTVQRLFYARLAIFTAFAGGIIYIILWIIMPENYRK
jgi:phage shock protein PspC (stress-responsive transcriptional regulator)